MGIYRELYDFASKAGALEGYVYHKDKVEPSYLPGWVEHLVEQYLQLPPEVREDFQPLCDGTLGRAIRSLIPLLGEDHEVIKKLKVMVKNLPSSPNDFTHGR